MSGGYNTIFERPEVKGELFDSRTERSIEMANMLEPKFKHKVICYNSRIYVLGGYANEGEKSKTMYKYDFDL